MENKLQKLNSIKNISLTQAERDSMRAAIAYQMSIYQAMPRVSWIQKSAQHGLRIVLSTSMFIVFVCGSISVVANSALPGDPLYTFKLNVNEEVKGAFLKTPTAKIAWQKSRIETRLDEIQTLANTKTLTQAKQATLEKALDDHVLALNKELTTLSENDPSAALATTTTIEASLKAKKDAVLGTTATADVGSDAAKTAAAKTIDGALQKVSDQEVQLLHKELDTIQIDTQKTTVETSTSTTSQTTPPKPVTPSEP